MDKLKNYRKSIDLLDEAIICLLAERMRVVEKVGIYKKRKKLSPLQSKRWRQVLSSKLKEADELGLNKAMVEDIYNRIHQASLELEENI